MLPNRVLLASLLLQTVLLFAVSADGPKLRVLIAVPTGHFKKAHFFFHKRLAEILLGEEARQHIEYVHLLALTTAIEEVAEGNRLQRSPDGRFVVQFEPMDGKGGDELTKGRAAALLEPLAKLWTERLRYNPTPRAYNKWRGLLQNEELIDALNALNFNVGIVETTNTAGLALFQMLPSIRRTVATCSLMPYVNVYDHLGYPEVNLRMPDVNNAELGDHLIVGKGEAELRQTAEIEADGDEQNAKRLFQQFLKRQTEIAEKNEELLGIRRVQDAETWKSYNPVVVDYLRTRGLLPSEHYQCPSLKQLFLATSHFFVNSQPNIGFPFMEKALEMASDSAAKRLPGEKLHFVGGIGLLDKLQLDKTTQAILDGTGEELVRIVQASEGKCTPPPSEHFKGTILVSFGSGMKWAVADAQRLAEVFRRVFREMAPLGYQFVWKARDSGEGHYECDGNVFTNDWLPQPGILDHPNTRLFVSHCGENGVQEAAHANVPLVCFPLFGDQYFNAEALASRGWATVLDARRTDSEQLAAELGQAMRAMLAKGKPLMGIKSREETAAEFLKAVIALRDEM